MFQFDYEHKKILSLYSGLRLGGCYEFVELIGRGSFGEVWQALKIPEGKRVALKVPLAQHMSEAFLRQEVKNLLGREGKHLVKIFSAERVEGGLFVIEMEYFPSVTLKALLEGTTGREVTFASLLDMFSQLCNGLAEMHQMDITHGDLKPENILVDYENLVKITDFGNSRRLEEIWVETKGGGTMLYMAPEVMNEQRRSKISDIFSLGVILYQMITGYLPYRTPAAMYQRLPIARPRELNPVVTTKLENLVFKMLAYDPEDRYQSVSEFSSELDKVCSYYQQMQERPPAPDASYISSSANSMDHMDYAEMLLQQGKEIDAIQELERAAYLDKDDAKSRLRLLSLYRANNCEQKALKMSYELFRFQFSHNKAVELWREALIFSVGMKDYSFSLKIIDRLIQLQGEETALLYQKGLILGMLSNYKDAIKVFKLLKEKEPKNPKILYRLALAHWFNNQQKEAVFFFNEVINLFPNHPQALYYLTYYYGSVGNQRLAEEKMERLAQAPGGKPYFERLMKKV